MVPPPGLDRPPSLSISHRNCVSPNFGRLLTLTDSELDSVTGGMNLDRVRESTNVIDARGGSSTVGA
jgi:hypothetical protein